MKTFLGDSFGRTMIICLKEGDLILESIQDQCHKNGFRNAVVVSGIASCDVVSYHRVLTTENSPREEYVKCKSPIEVASLQGLILDGVPHLHIGFADLDRSYAAHLEPGTRTLYVAEILIAELRGFEGVQRRRTKEGVPELIKED